MPRPVDGAGDELVVRSYPETLKTGSRNLRDMAREFSLDRRAYLTTVGVAGVAGLAGCLGNGDSEDQIVAGTAPGFPPFEFVENGELRGFDIDLTEEVVGQTDYEFGGWEQIEFDSLIPSLTDGQIDLIAAAMTINDERAEQIAFSDPYYEANQSVLVAEDGDFDPSGEGDLEGRTVGAQSGTTGEDEVERLIEEGIVAEEDFRGYDNYTLAVQDLENGNVDAVVIDIPVAEQFEANRAVRVAFTIDTGEEYGLGLRQGDDRVEAVDDGLAEVKDDGTYDDLIAEWFGTDD